jgi:hypothetical protein
LSVRLQGERIGRLQNARSKKREKESAEDFKATFGENWREESTSLFNLFSDEFGSLQIHLKTN